MIPLSQLARRASKTVMDNSPVILTSAAVAGVASTAFLAAKGSFKAAEILNGNDRDTPPLNGDLKEQFAATWKCYIPAAATGAATVVFIIGANHISSRRHAAALSLYTLSETAFKEYKDKVKEQIGVNKEQKIRDAVVEDRIKANPPRTELLVMSDGKVPCYDVHSDRYFMSDMQSLRKAENDINFQINTDMNASLSEFYNLIGLPPTSFSDEIGWNLDNRLELEFTSVLHNETPYMAFCYKRDPKPDFHKVW